MFASGSFWEVFRLLTLIYPAFTPGEIDERGNRVYPSFYVGSCREFMQGSAFCSGCHSAVRAGRHTIEQPFGIGAHVNRCRCFGRGPFLAAVRCEGRHVPPVAVHSRKRGGCKGCGRKKYAKSRHYSFHVISPGIPGALPMIVFLISVSYFSFSCSC